MESLHASYITFFLYPHVLNALVFGQGKIEVITEDHWLQILLKSLRLHAFVEINVSYQY